MIIKGMKVVDLRKPMTGRVVRADDYIQIKWHNGRITAVHPDYLSGPKAGVLESSG